MTKFIKVAVSEESPEPDKIFLAFDENSKGGIEFNQMVLDSEKNEFFYFPSDIHTDAPEFWIKEVEDNEAVLLELNKRYCKKLGIFDMSIGNQLEFTFPENESALIKRNDELLETGNKAIENLGKALARNQELEAMLEKVKNLEPIICLGGIIEEQHRGEAQTLNNMMIEITELLKNK